MMRNGLIYLLLLTSVLSFTQHEERFCAHDLILQQNKNLHRMFNESNRLIQESILKTKSAKSENAAVTYTIPVVVHILHKGEPYGVGYNIPDEQVFSQIDVLNEDFNRLNSDTSNIPPEYKPLAGRINLNFCLAKLNPDCEFTNGITRQTAIKRNNFGVAQSFGLDDDTLIKSYNRWPTDQYLNIWVCDLAGFVGYSTFPYIPQLGITEAEIDQLDGIVIQTTAFGRNSYGKTFNLKPTYNRGRTATHEVGHWLGLLHTWGVNSCINQIGCQCGDDFCDDTPATESPLTTCTLRNSFCTGKEVRVMRENYMDYTPDACMNLFTNDQVARMLTVLQLNERRKKILKTGYCDFIQPNTFTLPQTDSLVEGKLSETIWRNSTRHELNLNPMTNKLALTFSDTSAIISNTFSHNSHEKLFLDLDIYKGDNGGVLEIFLTDKGCSENWRKVAIVNLDTKTSVGAGIYDLGGNRFRILMIIPKQANLRKLMIQKAGINTQVYIEKIRFTYQKQELFLNYDENLEPTLSYTLDLPATSELSVYDVYGNSLIKKSIFLADKGSLSAFDLGLVSKGIYIVKLKTELNNYTFKLFKP